MKILMLVMLVLLLVVPLTANALDMYCAQAVAAGGKDFVANMKCLYAMAVAELNPDLDLFYRW